LKEKGTTIFETFYSKPEDKIQDHIISKDLNKNEWITYLQGQVDNVNSSMNNPDGVIFFKDDEINELKNYVSLYESVIKELKDTWDYGDFDTYG